MRNVNGERGMLCAIFSMLFWNWRDQKKRNKLPALADKGTTVSYLRYILLQSIECSKWILLATITLLELIKVARINEYKIEKYVLW